jgi:hypothetical protein
VATYRVQMSFPYDSSFPRDAISINPHFNGSDPQALANALKANLIAFTPVADKPFTIKVYEAGHAPPNFPLAVAQQAGTPVASNMPREIALCLSYYTTYNRPRFRGRLYLPGWWYTSVPQVRPTAALTDEVIKFPAQVLAKALPSQTNWVVYSKREGKSQGGVTDVWCDNEWDTQRSRGLKADARSTGKVA